MVKKAADPVQNLQDDDLVEHIIQLRAKNGNARVTEISESYVAKYYGEDQIDDVVQAVAKAGALDVRVPLIKRVAKGDGHVECIQEHIHGRTLMDAWTDIGWFSTFRLAFQLRGMLRRMRAATSPNAGGHKSDCGLVRHRPLPLNVAGRQVRCASAGTAVNNFFNR